MNEYNYNYRTQYYFRRPRYISKCDAHTLILWCWRLFDYETTHLALLVDLYGKEKALKSTVATRMLMYAISADMILKGEY